jgi:hypothetical protein
MDAKMCEYSVNRLFIGVNKLFRCAIRWFTCVSKGSQLRSLPEGKPWRMLSAARYLMIRVHILFRLFIVLI